MQQSILEHSWSQKFVDVVCLQFVEMIPRSDFISEQVYQFGCPAHNASIENIIDWKKVPARVNRS